MDASISASVGLRRRVSPPLTWKVRPVMKHSSLAMKTAALAMYSTVFNRPSGYSFSKA